MHTIIETDNLTKIYHDIPVVNQVKMTIQQGEIYGLIGRNGAGKTTLMRMICGLSKPSKGNYRLFDESDIKQFPLLRQRIGCLIESPAFNPNLSAAENLECVRMERGIRKGTRTCEVLEQVGLQDAGRKKAGQYSLGMKQRLGLAIALYSKPDLLILDEPINGLDPVGVVEIRELLIKLNREGTTMLISSHILSELNQLASCYGIMHSGEMLDELKASDIETNLNKTLEIKTHDIENARQVLLNTYVNSDIIISGETLKWRNFKNNAAEVNRILVENGYCVSSFKEEGQTIESYFLKKIGDTEL